MNRAERAAIAQQTLTILENGGYAVPGGATVSVAQDLRNCVDATQLFSPDELEALMARVLSRPSASAPVIIEIENESTLSGIARLLHEGCAPVAALNFASANSPGGGFLRGSQAQEESLARSSGLYARVLPTPSRPSFSALFGCDDPIVELPDIQGRPGFSVE